MWYILKKPFKLTLSTQLSPEHAGTLSFNRSRAVHLICPCQIKSWPHFYNVTPFYLFLYFIDMMPTKGWKV